MGTTMKTRQAAEVLGTNTAALRAAIERGKIAAPAKDCSGDYVWTVADIATAMAALSVDRRRKEHRQPQPA